MPDLGKYADAVLSAYAVSIALLVAIVVLSLWRGRRVRAEMEDVERTSTCADRGATGRVSTGGPGRSGAG